MSPIRVGLAQGCQQPSNKSGQNPVPRIIAVWIVPLSICPKGTSKAWLNWVSLFFFAREYFRKFVERARYKNALHRLRVFFLHQNCLLIPLFQKPFEVPLHRQHISPCCAELCPKQEDPSPGEIPQSRKNWQEVSVPQESKRKGAPESRCLVIFSHMFSAPLVGAKQQLSQTSYSYSPPALPPQYYRQEGVLTAEFPSCHTSL